MKKIIIEENDRNQRADRFLVKHLPNAKKNFLMKMLRKKNIMRNGKRLHPEDILEMGDVIEFFFSDETYEKFKGKDKVYSHVSLDIIYEDDHVLVLDKPAGLLSHSASKLREKNLVDGAIKYLIEKGEYNPRAENSFTPAICNRLDRNTSGIVMVGKTNLALKLINEALRGREVSKYYYAIVVGEFCNDGLYETSMTRLESKNISLLSRDGKHMVTEIHTISKNKNLSLLRVKLVTGRTHQIRVQLQALGHSILGDPKYGNSNLNQKYGQKHQLLSAVEMILPNFIGDLNYLSGKKFVSKYKMDMIQKYQEWIGD
ncbi:MAG: RluA family pseudouridine synthase [Tissierellia bacterium]|nr:RluA family pseudouridine synthase [Tissierellia bacterium]